MTGRILQHAARSTDCDFTKPLCTHLPHQASREHEEKPDTRQR